MVNSISSNSPPEKSIPDDKLNSYEGDYFSELNEMPVMMHSINEVGDIIFVNEFWLEKMEFTRDEVLGKKSSAFLTERCRELAKRKYLPKFFRNGFCRDVPYTFVKKTGGHLEVLLSASFNEGENGQVSRSFAILNDVTERKKLDEELSVSNRNTRRLIDEMPNGFVLHDIICDENDIPYDFSFLKVNTAYEKLTGLKSEDLIGKTVIGLNPDCEHFWIETFGRVALGGGSTHFERFVPDFQKYFEIHAYSPKPKQVAVVFTDITDRKMSELATSHSEKLFRRTFDQSPIGVGMLGVDGGFMKVNQELCRITGYTASELTQMNYLDITYSADIEKCKEQVADLLGGRIRQLEIDKRYIRKDGTIIWTRVSSRLIKDSNNKPLFFIPMIQDIDERKKLGDEKAVLLDLLKLITEESNLKELVMNLLKFFKNISNADAIAVRLKQGDDYPYFLTHGFPESFLQRETSICAESYNAMRNNSTVNEPKVECMCGSVVTGSNTEQFASFFTNSGSFHTNSTTLLLDELKGFEKPKGVRRHCHAAGYESVLLIPLRVGDNTLGLIQLNDKKKNKFSTEFVGLMERLSHHVSVAMVQRLAEEELHYKKVELEETNAALKVLARNREEELQENSKELMLNIRQLVLPYIERLKLGNLDKQQQAQLKILESNLTSITAPLNNTMVSASSLLTPSLLQVADMIRNGLTNKEIAKVLGISVASVETYRKRIRARLNLQNSKVNLRSHLIGR